MVWSLELNLVPTVLEPELYLRLLLTLGKFLNLSAHPFLLCEMGRINISLD